MFRVSRWTGAAEWRRKKWIKHQISPGEETRKLLRSGYTPQHREQKNRVELQFRSISRWPCCCCCGGGRYDSLTFEADPSLLCFCHGWVTGGCRCWTFSGSCCIFVDKSNHLLRRQKVLQVLGGWRCLSGVTFFFFFWNCVCVYVCVCVDVSELFPPPGSKQVQYDSCWSRTQTWTLMTWTTWEWIRYEGGRGGGGLVLGKKRGEISTTELL